MYNVVVTGIGGNVGQGILRNIRKCNYPITLIGTNTEEVSAGNHLCDHVYEVPIAYDESYVPAIKRICDFHGVSIIIPSTDYETYYLGLNRDSLPVVAASEASTAKVFLDKYLTWQSFKKIEIPFAETILPFEYTGQFENHIVKPKEGRGSRGIHINHPEPGKFGDDYIVQKLYMGKETTTAFYVKKNNELLGHITLVRNLKSGTTDSCEVVDEYDDEMETIIKKMLSAFEIRGSCNIQSIVESSGNITPFEVNCRISGTNSIRTHFGFEDVKYTLQEYLLNEDPAKPTITHGAALRLLTDVIYPGRQLAEITNNSDNYFLF